MIMSLASTMWHKGHSDINVLWLCYICHKILGKQPVYSCLFTRVCARGILVARCGDSEYSCGYCEETARVPRELSFPNEIVMWALGALLEYIAPGHPKSIPTEHQKYPTEIGEREMKWIGLLILSFTTGVLMGSLELPLLIGFAMIVIPFIWVLVRESE